MAEQSVTRKLAAILAANVIGYSRHVGADEEGTIAGTLQTGFAARPGGSQATDLNELSTLRCSYVCDRVWRLGRENLPLSMP